MSRKMYAPYLAEGDPYYNKQLDLYSCVPKMKAETEEISVEKKIVDEYLHGDYEAGVFNSQEIDTHIAEINPYICLLYTSSGPVFQISDSLLQLVFSAFGLKIEKRISSKLLKFRL